jgi:peptide deformylase
MSIKEILIYSEKDTALRRTSEPIESVNRRVRRLIRDLKDTLRYHSEGVGLAAPQINVHNRIVVVRLGIRDFSQDNPERPIALINPVILEAGNEKRDFDGCLSFPGLYAETVRPHYLRVSGLDEQGTLFNQVFEDFDAVLVHHEIDHLEGVLFIDRITSLGDLYRIDRDEYGRSIRIPISADLDWGDRQTITRLHRG